jgi:PRTRC genetic system protein C
MSRIASICVANCGKSVNISGGNLQNNIIIMSPLRVETLHREFLYNGTRIPDPAPNMSVEQVRELLTPSYPEIATATLEGPEDTGTALRYSFSRAIGSKG